MILTIAKCFWKIQQKKTVENSFNCYDKVMNLMKKEETYIQFTKTPAPKDPVSETPAPSELKTSFKDDRSANLRISC